MTLIVSTRVPDGIAIAADSISTISAGRNLTVKGETKCPKCGSAHSFESPIDVPIGPGITSTMPYSQKLQPLWNKYGIGTHGTGLIGERTVFAIVREFEQKGDKAQDLRATANALAKHFHNALKGVEGFSKIPDKAYALGCQVVGYQDDKPLSIVVDVGKEYVVKEWGGFGATVSGNIYLAQKLWELKGLGPELGQLYPAWSLQDAAEYCEFLIDTTAKYQRFANTIPTVGGKIDIGYVLPSNKFHWIRKKPLATILFEE